jgi:hypothetical protein
MEKLFSRPCPPSHIYIWAISEKTSPAIGGIFIISVRKDHPFFVMRYTQKFEKVGYAEKFLK